MKNKKGYCSLISLGALVILLLALLGVATNTEVVMINPENRNALNIAILVCIPVLSLVVGFCLASEILLKDEIRVRVARNRKDSLAGRGERARDMGAMARARRKTSIEVVDYE